MPLDKADPRLRFTLLVSLLSVLFVIGAILTAAFTKQVTWQSYITNLSLLLFATCAGFCFMWVGTTLMMADKLKKIFSRGLKVDVVARIPTHHPLESDILGFLLRYQQWPIDPQNPQKGFLYQRAYEKWQHYANQPLLYRIAVLARDLGYTESFSEKRTCAPWWQFWEKDALVYVPVCDMHMGLSCTVLSKMPHFTDLSMHERHVLLTALRFYKQTLPHGSPEQTKPLHQFLNQLT